MTIGGREQSRKAKVVASDLKACADARPEAADQVDRDLRDSAEAVGSLLQEAFQRLHALDRDSPATALVGQAMERFREIHRDILALTANRPSSPAPVDAATPGDHETG